MITLKLEVWDGREIWWCVITERRVMTDDIDAARDYLVMQRAGWERCDYFQGAPMRITETRR